jgi:hypothetical protein
VFDVVLISLLSVRSFRDKLQPQFRQHYSLESPHRNAANSLERTSSSSALVSFSLSSAMTRAAGSRFWMGFCLMVEALAAYSSVLTFSSMYSSQGLMQAIMKH